MRKVLQALATVAICGMGARARRGRSRYVAPDAGKVSEEPPTIDRAALPKDAFKPKEPFRFPSWPLWLLYPIVGALGAGRVGWNCSNRQLTREGHNLHAIPSKEFP